MSPPLNQSAPSSPTGFQQDATRHRLHGGLDPDDRQTTESRGRVWDLRQRFLYETSVREDRTELKV